MLGLNVFNPNAPTLSPSKSGSIIFHICTWIALPLS
jgi:hypothetical protein